MNRAWATSEFQVANPNADKPARRAVIIFQILFLAVLLAGLDGPFLSAHNERQNQTYDMARHVFRDGWSSVLTPKVSIVYPSYETQRYSAVLFEVPFHGLIGWPFARLTTHTRAVTRLVSAAFALISIQLMYRILNFWLPPAAAALGAGVWAFAPLLLHFGQVPMPDILCTGGILAAFWFALRGRLAASSGAFLFALLAKLNVIAFGLPILVALAVARNDRSKSGFLRTAVLWGWLPLGGTMLWEFLLHHFAPPTHMSLEHLMADRGDWGSLVHFPFYKFVLGCLFPFGFGLLGLLGLVFAAGRRPVLNPWLKWSMVFSNLFFFLFVIRKVQEPQYLLPVLAWCVMAASFGFPFLLQKFRQGGAWRMALGAALLVHLAVAALFTLDLKASRVPGFPDIERAAKLLPPDARVLVLYQYYGASPAVWLDRTVLANGGKPPSEFPHYCELAYNWGFTHLLILDIESWHNEKSDNSPLALAGRVFHGFRKTASANASSLPGFAGPSSPYRQFCDRVLSPLLASPHAVLYSMESLPQKKALGKNIVWPANP